MAVLLGVLAVPLRLLCVHSMLRILPRTRAHTRALPADCATRCTADGYGYGYGYYGRYGHRGHLIAEQEEQQQGLVQGQHGSTAARV